MGYMIDGQNKKTLLHIDQTEFGAHPAYFTTGTGGGGLSRE
jgi:hypothetical protein